MGLPSRGTHSAETRSNATKDFIDDLTNRFNSCHIQRLSSAHRNARRARIRYLHFITLDETKHMWDGPENVELRHLQREEFAEEAARKKEMKNVCNIFKKYIKSEFSNEDNLTAGGAAAGKAASAVEATASGST